MCVCLFVCVCVDIKYTTWYRVSITLHLIQGAHYTPLYTVCPWCTTLYSVSMMHHFIQGVHYTSPNTGCPLYTNLYRVSIIYTPLYTGTLLDIQHGGNKTYMQQIIIDVQTPRLQLFQSSRCIVDILNELSHRLMSLIRCNSSMLSYVPTKKRNCSLINEKHRL